MAWGYIWAAMFWQEKKTRGKDELFVWFVHESLGYESLGYVPFVLLLDFIPIYLCSNDGHFLLIDSWGHVRTWTRTCWPIACPSSTCMAPPLLSTSTAPLPLSSPLSTAKMAAPLAWDRTSSQVTLPPLLTLTLTATQLASLASSHSSVVNQS